MSERERLEFVAKRDGPAAADEFAAQTLGVYLMALNDPTHHANLRQYKPRFQAAVGELIDDILGGE